MLKKVNNLWKMKSVKSPIRIGPARGVGVAEDSQNPFLRSDPYTYNEFRIMMMIFSL